LESYRVDVTWLGSNVNALPSGLAPMPGITNYYLPSCEAGALGVQSFARVQYANIYAGFDLAFYQTDGHLEYDFIGNIGADPRLIQFQYEGQTALYVDGQGQLVVETPFGKLTEHRPLVTQAGRQLQASWKVVGAVASIEIQNLDANLPFVIDPVVRAWGTYLGGTATDIVRSSAADGLGNVTIVGSTASNAPAVFAPVGAFQTAYGGGLQDAFITKFDGNGNRVWSTYFGRTLNDEALDCHMVEAHKMLSSRSLIRMVL
jgi:hypothetical protein